jgi:hypothetical protein
MHRRALLKAVVAFPVAATAAMLPNISEAANNLVPLEKMYVILRHWLGEWGLGGEFEDEELRAYIEFSIDWMNARLEGEEINAFLPGDPEQVIGDAIYTELQGRARQEWLGCIQWWALAHATFALGVNATTNEHFWVSPEKMQEYKLVAEDRHEGCWEHFLPAAEAQYRRA